MSPAIEFTPHGVPFVAYPIGLAIVLLAAWDATTVPPPAWLRWLEPVGAALVFAGLFMLTVWVSLFGLGVAAVGLGLGRRRR